MMSDFQNDLKTGMTLTDALTKHNITLADALHQIRYPPKEPQQRNTKNPDKKYIQYRNGTYHIQKTEKGISKTYGTYRKLYEAKQVRDALIVDGWNQHNVDKICKELGIRRIKGHRNKRYE